MGGQQSTAGVIRQGTGAAPLSKQVTSEELQRAYEKGKEESSLMFQDTLDKVASQVPLLTLPLIPSTFSSNLRDLLY